MAFTTTGIESLRATAATLESQVERFHLDVPSQQASKFASQHKEKRPSMA